MIKPKSLSKGRAEAAAAPGSRRHVPARVTRKCKFLSFPLNFGPSPRHFVKLSPIWHPRHRCLSAQGGDALQPQVLTVVVKYNPGGHGNVRYPRLALIRYRLLTNETLQLILLWR
jgi:hypothetical protein